MKKWYQRIAYYFVFCSLMTLSGANKFFRTQWGTTEEYEHKVFNHFGEFYLSNEKLASYGELVGPFSESNYLVIDLDSRYKTLERSIDFSEFKLIAPISIYELDSKPGVYSQDIVVVDKESNNRYSYRMVGEKGVGRDRPIFYRESSLVAKANIPSLDEFGLLSLDFITAPIQLLGIVVVQFSPMLHWQ